MSTINGTRQQESESETGAWTRQAPKVHVKATLSPNVYSRSSSKSDYPRLIVTTTLLTPSVLTIETRGETDSQTILDQGFRAEHFEFYDLTASEVVTHELFRGTCDSQEYVDRTVVMELHASKPHVTEEELEDGNVFADPVNILKTSHQYRLKLKPQRIRCWEGSVDDFFGEKEHYYWKDLPEPMELLLACDDELLLKIEG